MDHGKVLALDFVSDCVGVGDGRRAVEFSRREGRLEYGGRMLCVGFQHFGYPRVGPYVTLALCP